MDVLKYIAEKYKVNLKQRSQPLEIPKTTRDDMAVLFGELGFKIGAEIGVEQGVYSEILLKSNPHLEKLYSIDAWTAYDGYRDHVSQEEMDVLFQKSKERLSPYGDRSVMIKGFSVEVAKNFDDESLDFVYLDGNHEFVNVVNDIAVWETKVKVGGVVAGHDYIKRKGSEYMMHVPMAVHGYVESYQIRPLMVLGRKAAPKGERRDSTRSWLYVKPYRPPMKEGWQGWKKALDME